MQIETEIRVCYITTIGDNFSKDATEKEREELIEQHIRKFCEEKGIDRFDVEIVSSEEV